MMVAEDTTLERGFKKWKHGRTYVGCMYEYLFRHMGLRAVEQSLDFALWKLDGFIENACRDASRRIDVNHSYE